MADPDIQLLRARASAGEADAQFELACRYADGEGVPSSTSSAYRWFLRAAEADHVEAMGAVGRSLHHGLGIDRDPAAAYAWYERALEAGSEEVFADLGELLGLGDEEQRDIPRALSLLREGWERSSDEDCAGLLAEIYEEEPGHDSDAVHWHRVAAEAGYAPSMVALGYRHRLGEGVPRSFPDMLTWYRRAADQGDPVALGNLAVCYANGEGVRQDLGRAYRLRVRASELGHLPSEYWLAFALIDGTGTERDPELGRARLEELAAEEPEIAHDLAVRLLEGEGLELDVARGLDWMGRAAEAGHASALTYLGVLAWYGRHMEQDRAAAIDLYRRAADLGDPFATANLGFAYMEGDHVELDVERGVRLVRQGAAEGNAHAALWLTDRYLAGTGGFDRDPAEARLVLDACAREEEDGDVLFRLAEFMRDGIGGSVDLERALELFELAGINGRDARVETAQIRRQLRG